jgi:DNA replicative helicase MCM subunit Mcm2 (Cdc46/Mcm family)
MAYDVTGRLHEIFDEQQVSEKFRKREFVLEVQDGQYPQQIKFQLTQDKSSLIDPYKIGDEVKVTFDLRGRGFNKNGQMLYFTNLEAWRIEPASAGGAPAGGGGGYAQPQQASRPAPQNQNPNLRAQPSAAPIASDDDNDLPF